MKDIDPKKRNRIARFSKVGSSHQAGRRSKKGWSASNGERRRSRPAK